MLHMCYILLAIHMQPLHFSPLTQMTVVYGPSKASTCREGLQDPRCPKVLHWRYFCVVQVSPLLLLLLYTYVNCQLTHSND
jgi:hypothetical protein